MYANLIHNKYFHILSLDNWLSENKRIRGFYTIYDDLRSVEELIDAFFGRINWYKNDIISEEDLHQTLGHEL